ncbi:MAG: porin family protein [Rickettsiales bacterium]|nr:porin family protein [Rickettsiales bacterium]
MKNSLYLYLLSTAIAVSFTSEINAQTKNNWHDKFYIRGDIGAFIPANKFKSKSDDDAYITKKLKNTAVYNIGIGYKITDNIRSDLNLSYRKFKYKASEYVSGVNTTANTSQNIKSYSVFLNGYYDFININKIFKPYLTAGIGYGKNKTKNLKEVATGDVNATDNHAGASKNNFIWNAGFGTRFIVNKTFHFDLSYKYVDLGKTKMKAKVANTPSSQKIKAHEITGGIIINL